jgi:hypothetical protein
MSFPNASKSKCQKLDNFFLQSSDLTERQNNEGKDDPQEPVKTNDQFRKEPFQPTNITFPVDPASKRKFLPSWYSMFKWLEWDIDKNAAFCHICRQVHISGASKIINEEEVFWKTGFFNWKKAVEKFKKHETSLSHKACLEKFVYLSNNENVLQQLHVHQQQEGKIATACLSHIFTCLRYLARQGLAIRGHVDNESNFKQLLALRSNDLPDLKMWLTKKTTWTSVEIQEEMLEMMAHVILRKFSREVLDRKIFAVMADETADISAVEQLCICVRSVTDSLEVEENVLGFYAIDTCTGEYIFKAIQDSLLRLQIDLSKCKAVTFDGASAFSSQNKGVGARIQEVSPAALQTHCHMHCVNLAVQDAAKTVALMRDFLQLANDLITFLRYSPKRCAIVRNNAIQLNNPQTHIRPLCPTRFTMKFVALHSLQKQLKMLIDSLQNIESQATDRTIRATANGFLRRLDDFDFFLCLEVSITIFEITDRLSTQLQNSTASVGDGLSFVRHTLQVLESLRSDNKFKEIWTAANTTCQEHNGNEPKLPRQVRAPRKLQESEPYVHTTPEDFYRKSYFEILDTVTESLKMRITNKALPILEATEKLIQHAWNGKKPTEENLQLVCTHYSTDLIKHELEAQLLPVKFMREKNSSGDDSMKTIVEAIGKSILKPMIPQVITLLKLYLVCPATTATPERSFSQLRRLKTYLRSTMQQKRLNSLLILSAYPDETDTLDIKEITNDFILKNDMRRKTFCLL